MTKEFKIKKNSEQETVYTLESASSGGTSSGSIASTSTPIGGIQRRASLVTSEDDSNPVDTVTMDIPLLIRIMEYSREDAKTDMDLHHVVEKLITLSKTGDTLSMKNYNQVVSSHEKESHGDVGNGWGQGSYDTYAGTRHGRGVMEDDAYIESLTSALESTIEGSNAEYDDEAGMAQGNLHTIARAAQGLLDTIDNNENLPEWAQEKIAKVEGMLTAVWDYLISQEEQGVDPRVNESAAWQRKSGKSKTGGLNAKGVASYRRENPGSKLQTAVTTKPSKLKPGSKDAKRRKSFCARMGGMAGAMKKPNGDPTRKALALRKWHCESIEQTVRLLTNVNQDLLEMKQRLDPKCWKGKHKEGTKVKGGIRVNNCVPNESSDPYIESLNAKLDEKIPKGADAGYYIKDFEKSNAPQFRGKSKEKRKQMALAAFRDSQTKK